MKIRKIEYRIFSAEIETVKNELFELCHEIDGEVRFIGGEGQKLYSSWEMGRGVYGICLSDTPKFKKDADMQIIEASNSPIWCGVINTEIRFKKLGAHHQVLSISNDQHEVFVCAYQGKGPENMNGWDMDVVHVSKVIPEGMER